MITQDKVRIYVRYRGDVDGWVRVGIPEERKAMSDQDWSDIAELLSRLSLINTGAASESFAAKTRQLLVEKTDGEGTISKLTHFASVHH